MFEVQSKPFVPRSFQETGIVIGIRQACAGFLLPPGLGKTTIVYSIFTILKEQGFVDKMLVICPLKPAYNVWPRQCKTWNEFKHLRVCVLHGKDKEKLLASDDYDIYVINPEGLTWLFNPDAKNRPDPARRKLVKDKFGMLYVDESHKFKDTSTKRFKLMRNIVPVFKRRYIGTGTLNPEGLEGVFGQVYLLDEGAALGQYITHFRNKYFHKKQGNEYDLFPNEGAVEDVALKIAELCLHVPRSVLKDVPDVVFDDRFIDLPPPAWKAYLQAERDLLVAIEEKRIVAANAAVASSKCRQIANGFLYDENKEVTRLHTEKLEECTSIVEELAGEPVIITYEFEEDRDMLLALGYPSISTGNAKRDDMTIERFRRGLHPVVIGSSASISLGIDGLQDVCGHMIMFGVTWKLSDYIQLIDRIRRQGSKHGSVVIHRLLARGTVDERIVRKLATNESEMVDFMQLLMELRQPIA